MPADQTVIFVVATTPQAGKSTVAARIGERLGRKHIATSTIINRVVEHEQHLPAGTIAAARAKDPERYRTALITAGNRMDETGTPAGVVALREGYRIIEGIRRANELRQAIEEAHHMALRTIVVCLERPDRSTNDNTEVSGLRSLADYHISNGAGLDDLLAGVDAFCDWLDADGHA